MRERLGTLGARLVCRGTNVSRETRTRRVRGRPAEPEGFQRLSRAREPMAGAPDESDRSRSERGVPSQCASVVDASSNASDAGALDSRGTCPRRSLVRCPIRARKVGGLSILRGPVAREQQRSARPTTSRGDRPYPGPPPHVRTPRPEQMFHVKHGGVACREESAPAASGICSHPSTGAPREPEAERMSRPGPRPERRKVQVVREPPLTPNPRPISGVRAPDLRCHAARREDGTSRDVPARGTPPRRAPRTPGARAVRPASSRSHRR